MVKQWEAGKITPGPRYQALYAEATGFTIPELFGDGGDQGDDGGDVESPLELVGAHLPPLNGERADAAFVDTIRDTSQALVRLDSQHGGNDVLPLALRVFRNANHKIGAGNYDPAVERDLMAAAGEAGEVAAWMAYDADRQDASRQIIHESLLLSRQAGDRSMELFQMTHLAMQSIHLHRPAEAYRIATDLADSGLSKRVAALLEIRKGRALAQFGQGTEALSALGKARSTLLDGITASDPHWSWWVNDSEVIWHTGFAHAELGDWAAAIPLFHEASELREERRKRARYNDMVYLLGALVRVADWGEAETLLTKVAGMVGEVGSGRTENLLRRIVGKILRAGAPSTVADLAAEIGQILAHEAR